MKSLKFPTPREQLDRVFKDCDNLEQLQNNALRFGNLERANELRAELRAKIKKMKHIIGDVKYTDNVF